MYACSGLAHGKNFFARSFRLSRKYCILGDDQQAINDPVRDSQSISCRLLILLTIPTTAENIVYRWLFGIMFSLVMETVQIMECSLKIIQNPTKKYNLLYLDLHIFER